MTKAGVILLDQKKVGDIDIDIDEDASADEFAVMPDEHMAPLPGFPGGGHPGSEPMGPRGFGRPSRGTGPLFRPHIGPRARPRPDDTKDRIRPEERLPPKGPGRRGYYGPDSMAGVKGLPGSPSGEAAPKQAKDAPPESEVQLRGVDPRLVENVKKGANEFMAKHPGWKWKITSGYSPTHGRPTSLHRQGRALDMQLYEPGVGWLRNIGLGPGTHEFAAYHEFALDVARQSRADKMPFSWGGYFHSGGQYDLMHMQESPGPTAYGNIAEEASKMPPLLPREVGHPGGPDTDAETPVGSMTSNEPDRGPSSAYLRNERRWIKDELDANPRLKRFLAGVLTHEESAGKRTEVAESLFNRLNALRRTHPDITLSDYLKGKYGQFYGPVQRGEINESYLRNQVDRYGNDYHEMDKALAGSNLVRGFTDQGSRGDPNFSEEVRSGQYVVNRQSGEVYGDHPGTPHARSYRVEQQRQVEAERRGGAVANETPEEREARHAVATAYLGRKGPHVDIGTPTETTGLPTTEDTNQQIATPADASVRPTDDRVIPTPTDSAMWNAITKLGGIPNIRRNPNYPTNIIPAATAPSDKSRETAPGVWQRPRSQTEIWGDRIFDILGVRTAGSQRD
jgi:hypothetical protein